MRRRKETLEEEDRQKEGEGNIERRIAEGKEGSEWTPWYSKEEGWLYLQQCLHK